MVGTYSVHSMCGMCLMDEFHCSFDLMEGTEYRSLVLWQIFQYLLLKRLLLSYFLLSKISKYLFFRILFSTFFPAVKLCFPLSFLRKSSIQISWFFTLSQFSELFSILSLILFRTFNVYLLAFPFSFCQNLIYLVDCYK